MLRIRISRPCYDKWWRCPGWIGGGLKYGKVDRCDSGSLGHIHEWTWRRKWHCHRCPTCGLLVLPPTIQWVDPTWWFYLIRNPSMARMYTQSWWILTSHRVRKRFAKK